MQTLPSQAFSHAGMQGIYPGGMQGSARIATGNKSIRNHKKATDVFHYLARGRKMRKDQDDMILMMMMKMMLMIMMI